MAKFYIGCHGNHYAITELEASHTVEAVEELRRTTNADGWVRLCFVDSDEWALVRFDSIVLIKPYGSGGRRFRHSAGGRAAAG
jgi:hypothetical protein